MNGDVFKQGKTTLFQTKVQGSSNIGTGTLALDSYGNRKDYVLNVKFFTFNFSKLEKVDKRWKCR